MKKTISLSFLLSKKYVMLLIYNCNSYIKQYLRSSGDNEELNQINKLKEENKKLKQRVVELERIIERMKKENS